jgi:hypothetical protein
MTLLDVDRISSMLAMREGRWEEMRQTLDRSLTTCLRAPYPYTEAKVCYLFGQLHTATARPEDARQQYRSALAICDRLRECRYRSHSERALEHLPQSATPARPKRTRVRARPA